jgi:hypothetical protein
MTNSDKKKQLVFNFILKNPGTTINSISTALKGKVSDLTVRKKVGKLVKDGDIEDRKTENGFHALYVSNREVRNQILNELRSIDDIGSLMTEPLTKLHIMEKSDSYVDRVNVQGYHVNLVGPFYNSFFAMLHYLLNLSKSDPRISKTDSAELFYKVMELMEKIAYQPFHALETSKILDRQKEELEIFRNQLSRRTKDTSIANVVLVESLIKKIVSFKERFLSST